MITNKKIAAYFDDFQQKQMLSFFKINKKTLEFSFDLEKLNEKGWIYAAIDDNNFNKEQGEINKIINSTKENVSQFICLSLESLWTNNSLENTYFYLFDNTEKDWNEILSPFNEYTLWNSAIFDINFNIFIIKPWSVGYNLLIAGEERIIKSICHGDGWLINQKYPIFPV